MSTPSSATSQRLALVVLLSLPISLFAQSGPTTVRRNVHHDVSLPLSEMIKHAPPPPAAPPPPGGADETHSSSCWAPGDPGRSRDSSRQRNAGNTGRDIEF